MDYYNDEKTAGDNTFFVTLPQTSPGCLAAHEFLRLLYVMLDRMCHMPRFILSDDDITGCQWKRTDTVKKTLRGTVLDMVRALTKYDELAWEMMGALAKNGELNDVPPPLVYSFHRSSSVAQFRSLTSGPIATTRADSFLLIRRCPAILRKGFYPSNLLCKGEADRKEFRRKVSETYVNINRKGSTVATTIELPMPAAAVYGQFEDYFLHMLLAHEGHPRTHILQGTIMTKAGVSKTRTRGPPGGITVADMVVLSRLKCAEGEDLPSDTDQQEKWAKQYKLVEAKTEKAKEKRDQKHREKQQAAQSRRLELTNTGEDLQEVTPVRNWLATLERTCKQ
ncbi:hypothetical protein DIPPA_19223 [Diplonema papillatum]|nr:hypothetical protein DIPPA_19223 [Diplonema papillatum]